MCLSESCIKTSASLMEYMNRTVDPCHDFYEFSCGNYIAETIIPDDKSSFTQFTILGKDLEYNARKLMEKEQKGEWKLFQVILVVFVCQETTHSIGTTLKILNPAVPDQRFGQPPTSSPS